MGRKRRKKRIDDVDGDGAATPYWSPVARPVFTRVQTASIVARHLVPLACLAFFGGSILQFLMLQVFNLAFTIVGIGAVGVAVSTRQEVKSTGWMDQLGALVTLALVCAIGSLVLSLLFGWIIVVAASYEAGGWLDAMLLYGMLGTVLAAFPGMVMQYQADLEAKLPEDARKRRDQPVVGVHLFSAAFIFLLSGFTLGWGQAGAIGLALLVTALFIFRDLRPDLARNLAR